MPLVLHVVTPSAEPLNVEVDEVVAPGAHGELGFLPGHIPLISALRPGVLTTIKEGRPSMYVVGFGFAEIDNDTVTLLASTFEPIKDIDVERAKRALADAQAKLKDLGPEDPGYIEHERRAARAQARIDAAARAS
ncbi:MAG: ATP synthase F1 subunit epsilon [Deltaproteobacteria bacterium]|nr:ATP synthase F1 subunit epsilon [Deltaproteobacteria bacterium]